MLSFPQLLYLSSNYIFLKIYNLPLIFQFFFEVYILKWEREKLKKNIEKYFSVDIGKILSRFSYQVLPLPLSYLFIFLHFFALIIIVN